MTLELRVLSGARVGARERFEQRVVAIGRHPGNDFRFDTTGDLEVSTRHAELRAVDGSWTLHDLQSTNGTFVNGQRIAAEQAVRDGDTIGFGERGPQLEVRMLTAAAAMTVAPSPDAPPSALGPSDARPVAAPQIVPSAARPDTTVRIAEAVVEQTRTLRRNFAFALATVVLAAIVAVSWWSRQSASREQELLSVIARSESASAGLQRAIAAMRPRDSLFAALLAEQAAVSRRAERDGREAMSGRMSASQQSLTQLSQRLNRATQMQQSIVTMDFSKVHDANEGAVCMVASDLEGTTVAGTAFGVSRAGLLVTNRHVVRTEAGLLALRIRVIFGNTKEWIPAHVVRVSESDDLALLQLDVPGEYPTVAGVSREGALAHVGSPVASIGYPHSIDTPMEGAGLRITARTSTAAGMVSKRLSDVLQIDSYAGKGSSGSPLFDANGNVVGVIYGGAPESNGRIVYAVPAERLAAFLRANGVTSIP